MPNAYWLINVRLETAYREKEGITITDTDLFHIQIDDGTIHAIVPASDLKDEDLKSLPCVNAAGLLLLPAFREMHIHIDKTYYGGPWKAVRPISSIFERMEEERRLLPAQFPYLKERARKLLDLVLKHGSTHVRTHINIDPVMELRNLQASIEVLEEYKDQLAYEVVAFTQHGLLHSNVSHLVREAVAHGAGWIGSVDPASVDGDIERSLHTLMDIAVSTGAGIDMHLHDRGPDGWTTLQRLAELTEEAGWQGKVAVSHAFAFADRTPETTELIERFAALNIAIMSTVPIGRTNMPLPEMRNRGVHIGLGTDSVTDHWSPFGNCDLLEKAGRLAEVYGYSDERSLSQALGFITGGVTPLSQDGIRQWPQVGDTADAVLVDASCSAEAVARRANRQAVLHRGSIVAGSLEGCKGK